MNQPLTAIGQLHKAYCDTSGFPLALTMDRIFMWERWQLMGWTEADLVQVLTYLKRKSDSGQHWARNALMFSALIRDESRFEELLAECRAQARVKQVNLGKAQALRATGRSSDPETSPSRTVAQVMRGNEELKKLLELRDSL